MHQLQVTSSSSKNIIISKCHLASSSTVVVVLQVVLETLEVVANTAAYNLKLVFNTKPGLARVPLLTYSNL